MIGELDIAAITGSVIVVAPHPDDETLGCGGMIAALSQKGVLVHTIFVTDGSSSHRNSPTWPADRIAKQREVEAAEALHLLGAGAQPRTFLRLKDAGMPKVGDPAYESAVGTVKGIIEQHPPDLVLVPWRRDPHCDHRDSWSFIHDVLARCRQAPDVLEYTIWLDELGVPSDFPLKDEFEIVRFTMPGIADLKRTALAAHRSQLGELIQDDPEGFVLKQATIDRLIKPTEIYWR